MFNDIETSDHLGNLIELYEFRIGTNKWFFASGETNVTYRSNVYGKTAVSNSGLQQSGDASQDDMTITIPTTTTLAQVLLDDLPSMEITVIMRRMHIGDNDAPIVWIGNVVSLQREQALALKLICNVRTASFNRAGLRLAWGRQCHHALYDRNCRVVPTDFDVNVTITGVDGTSVYTESIDAYENNYFAGGYIEWTNANNLIQRRGIANNNRSTIVIFGYTTGLATGMVIKAFPGCRRTTLDCKLKFNNLENYGGFPHLPGKSPFRGDPIF